MCFSRRSAQTPASRVDHASLNGLKVNLALLSTVIALADLPHSVHRNPEAIYPLLN